MAVSVLRLRRAVQWLVLAGLFALPWVNAGGWNAVMGNFYALSVFGVPVADPLGVVQTLAAGVVPGWKLWLGAGGALALALALGRVFCGWACPYGLLSELLWQVGGERRAGEPEAQGCGGGCAACAPEHKPGHAPGREAGNDLGWAVRAGLTLVGLAVGAVLGLPLLNALSAPGSLSLAPLLQVEGWSVAALALLPVALLLVMESALGQRWWCRYGCPQALALMAATWLGRRWGGTKVLAVRWTAGNCACTGGKEPCATACSMRLRPRGKHGPAAAHCVQCGECVAVCALHGKALRLGTGQNAAAGAAGAERR